MSQDNENEKINENIENAEGAEESVVAVEDAPVSSDAVIAEEVVAEEAPKADKKPAAPKAIDRTGSSVAVAVGGNKPDRKPAPVGDKGSVPAKAGGGFAGRGDKKGGFGGKSDGGRRGDRKEEPRVDDGIKTKLVCVNRITKVVKGGRNMRFSALVVAGDQKGKVGIGSGKAAEVAEAVKKAEAAARRAMVKIAINDITIPHENFGKYGTSLVLLKPAVEGNGIKAGGSVRAVVELAGIRNITTKMYGSRNPINAVKATFKGLTEIRDPEHIARLRGKTLDEILN